MLCVPTLKGHMSATAGLDILEMDRPVKVKRENEVYILALPFLSDLTLSLKGPCRKCRTRALRTTT